MKLNGFNNGRDTTDGIGGQSFNEISTPEKREAKAHALEKHMRKGFPITAQLAEKKFRISGTGFHRTLNRFRQKGMIIDSEWVEYNGDRFKRYRIDESQRVSSAYWELENVI